MFKSIMSDLVWGGGGGGDGGCWEHLKLSVVQCIKNYVCISREIY